MSNTLWFWATFGVALLGFLADEPALVKIQLLKALDSSPTYTPDLTVALGYNACVDLVVDGIALMEALPGDAPEDGKPSVPTPTDHPAVTSLSALREVFAYHFMSGSAAERVVVTADLFDVILGQARTLDSQRQSVGGNAALMAMQFARLSKAQDTAGAVLLGGVVGSDLGRMLGSGVRIAGKPAYDGDEVHLIMEYPSGAEWRGFTAPRANRFIITHDRSNGKLAPLEHFHTVVADESSPPIDLFVACGMHMVERAQPDDDNYRANRLASVRDAVVALRERHPGAVVHAELASVASDEHMAAIVRLVGAASDSIGLNEQEAQHLYNTIKSGALEFSGLPDLPPNALSGSSDSPPDSHAVATFLNFLFTAMPSLNRVHFHSLQFHVVAQRKGAPGWASASGSVAAGSVAATVRACDVSHVADLHSNDLDLLAKLIVDTTAPGAEPSSATITTESPVATWCWGDVEFALAPVLVCKEPRQTVGLGDAVSASGLAAHVAKA